MNFLGVGPLELIVILIVALVFVGPERLPRLAADVARTIRDIRRYTASFSAEFSEVIKEFEKETESERADWKQIGEGLNEASAAVSGAVRDAQADAAGNPSGNGATKPPAAPAAPSQPVTESEWREIAPRSANGHADAEPAIPEEQR